MFSVKTIFFKYLIAPSAIEMFSSTINESRSILNSTPKPWHVGHAPSGELNENIDGSSLPIVNPQ